MSDPSPRVAVITGASSGIGAATAMRLHQEGFVVVLGARRVERLHEIAERCNGRALPLDVTDRRSVAEFAAAIEVADILVNNAGMAAGRDPIEELPEEKLETMWATNVLGLVRTTQALLPKLREPAHIVNVGSVAGREVYRGGGGYTASKHAVRALTQTLRLELLGRPIRVSEVAPGLVHTEFSEVRFDHDAERAAAPYEGITPLTAEDIADCIAWMVTRPPHVNVDEVVIKPVAQAHSTEIARGRGL